MTLSSRAFRWDDVPAVHALISEQWRRNGPQVTLHVGDLYWGLRPQPGRDPETDIQLWYDRQGSLVGLAWWDHPEGGTGVAHPDAAELEPPILDWFEAEAHRRACAEFTTGCFDGDVRRRELLISRGYARAQHGDRHLLISLESEPAPPEPPAGYSVRSITGAHEFEARAAVHREAWSTPGPSSMTADIYRRLVSLPAYRQKLDLVAVAPDGAFASCCNVWYDEAIRVGEFEPVGCHPDHRRKGATRALMLEGLRRLRGLGAERAVVYTSTNNPGAQKLYESCGFQITGQYSSYTKRFAR